MAICVGLYGVVLGLNFLVSRGPKSVGPNPIDAKAIPERFKLVSEQISNSNCIAVYEDTLTKRTYLVVNYKTATLMP